MNYYNEHDPKAAAWLRELIADNLIPEGKVDERDIRGIPPEDLDGFVQHHFFCGIAGWPYALRLAGWPDERPVWTGSCPCPAFSVAGRGAGIDDTERHLWPAFRYLIAECQPPAVFGEQVGSCLGREWLAGVRNDLERMGFAVGAADLPACSVGAPHIRQRLFWVALAYDNGQRIERSGLGSLCGEHAFSWCKNVRGIEDLQGRSDIPQPLVRFNGDGLSDRVGNAIVPQLAATFIQAAEQAKG